MYEMNVTKMWFLFVLSSTIFSCLGVPSLGPIEAMAFPNTVHRLPDIYWNTSNPIFRIDNTDHIIDVNRNGQTGSEYDQVNIVCPLYDQRTNPNEEETEKFVIYHVKKEEYDTCQIMSAHPRILAQCDKPYSLRYFTISFRPFSPTPGALEFHPGKDYYFISTSSKTDLHRRVDGMCRTNNMRIVFKVADKSWHQNHKNRKDFQSSTVTMSTTTAILTSTTELSLDMEETKAIENLNVTNPYMDIDELETVDDDEKQKKKKKRKKKKKQRKDKKNNKTDVEGEERESVVQEEDVLMNDNPPNQVRQMEPSLVEKVNNLMKQEASISAAKPKVISNQHILISFALILTVLQPLLF